MIEKNNEHNEFQTITHDSLTCINIIKPDRQKIDLLSEKYPNFHKINLDDCLSNIQVPKIDIYRDHMFIILYFPVIKKQNVSDRNRKGETEDIFKINQLYAFLDNRNYIITLHHNDLEPLAKLFQQFNAGSGSVNKNSYSNRNDDKYVIAKNNNDSSNTTTTEDKPQHQEFMSNNNNNKSLKNSPLYVLYEIIDSLINFLFELLNKITNRLEEIEDQVFDDRVTLTKRISLIRRDVLDFLRIINPLKEIIDEIISNLDKNSNPEYLQGGIDTGTITDSTESGNTIKQYNDNDNINHNGPNNGNSDNSGNNHGCSSNLLVPYFKSLKHRIKKAIETLETANRTIEIYKDTNSMLSNEKINRVLTILTILSTLTIPITVISTIYGMNIKIPGRIEHPSTFLGPYITLIIVAIVSTASALMMLWLLYRRGWIVKRSVG